MFVVGVEAQRNSPSVPVGCIMVLTFALQGFAILQTVVSIALLPSVIQREPLPTQPIALPHQQWPALLAEHVYDSVAPITSWPCVLYDQRGK